MIALLREQGASGVLARLRFRLSEHAHDAWYGIDTSRTVYLATLGLQNNDAVEYTPTPWNAWRRVARSLQLGPTDVLVDYGCGMGRVLVAACRQPLARVVGVEFASALAAQARRNLAEARARGRLRCHQVEIVEGDAAAYVLPDDVSCVHLYNPFRGATLQRVLQQLRDSLERRPRALAIAYGNPGELESLRAAGPCWPADWLRATSDVSWPRGAYGPQAAQWHRIYRLDSRVDAVGAPQGAQASTAPPERRAPKL